MSSRRERQISFYADAELKKGLRERAYQESSTIQQLCEQAVYEFMKEKHEPPEWWPAEHEKKMVATALHIWRDEDSPFRKMLDWLLKAYVSTWLKLGKRSQRYS